MLDDPVFSPVAIFWVQTRRYLMDIEQAVLKLSFSNISPLRRGVERVFRLDFHVNVAIDMLNLGFKGL